MKPLLVLRPEPGATATVARAEALGLKAIAAPLFTIAPLDWDAPDPADHDALMLTSANAVRHAGPALARYATLPLYVVGAATAAAARTAGLAPTHVGKADADTLIAVMVAEGVRRPLHFAGREHRAAPNERIEVTRRLVYAADPVAALPSTAAAALRQGAVALLHSPRAAALFAELLDRGGIDRRAVPLAAISQAAAAAAGPGWAALSVAPAPTDPALLAAAAPLCE